MFSGCSSLKKINLSNFNTSNVTDMSYMFNGCSSLKDLNISNFNTDNVYYMNHMFSNCLLLNELDISNFKFRSVTNMRYMFSGCSGLKKLKISNFIFNCADKEKMFDGCLEELETNLYTMKIIKFFGIISIIIFIISYLLKIIITKYYSKNDIK